MNRRPASGAYHRMLSMAGLADLVWGRSVALVVDTDHLDGEGNGPRIDDLDVVIRFGKFSLHPRDLGTRADVHITDGRWHRQLETPVAVRIVCSGSPARWREMLPGLVVPGAQRLLGDESLRWPVTEAAGAVLESAPERTGHPTTTLLAIFADLIRTAQQAASVQVFGVCADAHCDCSGPSLHHGADRCVRLGAGLKSLVLGPDRAAPGWDDAPMANPVTRRRRPAAELAAARHLVDHSRYDEALDVLSPVTEGAGSAPARAQRARIHWICNDDRAALRDAVAALRADPTEALAQVIAERIGRPMTTPSDPESVRLAHVAFHPDRYGNFGDRVLGPVTRRAIGLPATGWTHLHAHRCFDRSQLEIVNRGRGLVIGGGGLFGADTAPNGVSGWQWNAAPEMLDGIEVPIVGAALGVNTFRSQHLDSDRFRHSLEHLAARAVSIGVRERASVEALRELLPAELRDRIRWFPCPTTLPEYHQPAPDDDESPFRRAGIDADRVVVLNVAMDRAALRYGEGYARMVAQLATVVERLGRDGVAVIHAAHHIADERFVADLRAHRSSGLHRVGLQHLSTETALAIYRHADAVVGSRTHSTAIPFGLGTPVLGLVSHDKVADFFADIGSPHWAVEASDPDLADRLAEAVAPALADPDEHRRTIALAQERLRVAITERVAEFHAALGIRAG